MVCGRANNGANFNALLLNALTKNSTQGFPVRVKLTSVAKLLVDLGCLNPSERIVQAVVATTWAIINGTEETERMSGVCKLNITGDFKSILKVLVKDAAKRGVTANIKMYPPNVDMIKGSIGGLPDAVYNKIYGSVGPVAVGLKDEDIVSAIHAWPMRKTASSVQQDSQKLSLPSSSMSGFMQFMQCMQQCMQSPRGWNADIPIKMMKTPQAKPQVQ